MALLMPSSLIVSMTVLIDRSVMTKSSSIIPRINLILLKQTGKGISLFGPIEAIVISFITASLLLLASISKGIPSSLVQVNTASIIGIGVARLGFKNILRKTSVNKFFIVWLIAPVFAFLISIFLTFVADRTGLLYLY
jgi:sulfate permease